MRGFFKRINLIYGVWVFSIITILFSAGLILYASNPDEFDLIAIFKNKYQKSADKIIRICEEDFNWRFCYGEQLARLSGRMELPDVLKVLDLIMTADTRTNDCHLIAHEVSAAELEKNPDDWLAMFKHVDQDMCMGGYIHGAVEGKKLIDKSMKIDETTIPDICDAIQSATGNKNIDPCSHVMGHILLVETAGDVNKASEICNKLPGKAMQSYCNNGMFMENITRVNLESHGYKKTFFITESSALEVQDLCKEFSGIAETSCWREMAHMYVELGDNDLGKVWELCSRASNDNNRNECYIHSFNSLLPLVNFDESQFPVICDNLSYDQNKYNRCYSWALDVLLLSSSNLSQRAVNLCNSVKVEFKEECFKMLGEKMSKVSSVSARELACKEVEGDYKKLCECQECQKSKSN